jgi:hypothetical protein
MSPAAWLSSWSLGSITLMVQIVPSQETRFWSLFRHLLIPIAIFSGLICLVCGIASACGEQAVFVNGKPLLGWRGVLACVICFPVATVAFSFTAAWVLFLHRRILPALFRVLFFWRRRS